MINDLEKKYLMIVALRIKNNQNLKLPSPEQRKQELIAWCNLSQINKELVNKIGIIFNKYNYWYKEDIVDNFDNYIKKCERLLLLE